MALPKHLVLAFTSIALAGCLAPAGGPADDDPNAGFTDGEPFDERGEAPADWEGKFDRPAPYEVPEDLPELVSPEVIISLEGLTVHLFDRATGYSKVFPAGVGALGRSGRSITPTGHFATSANTNDGWWNIATRWEPAYFEGYPFLRLTARNSRGYNTYGLHGPITNPLERGYVSHGCIRMAKKDIVELFFLVKGHASTPVTIQQELELDAAGEPVDVDTPVSLWAPGEDIAYGASVGPRVEVGFVGDACETDADCGGYAGASDAFCHVSGFCTQKCEGYCPDLAGRATTFCAADPTAATPTGVCMSKAGPENAECATVPGTVPTAVQRFVGASRASPAESRVCLPLPW